MAVETDANVSLVLCSQLFDANEVTTFESTTELKYTGLGVAVFGSVIVILAFCFFLREREKHLNLQGVQPIFYWYIVIGVHCGFLVYPLRAYIGGANYNCLLLILVTGIGSTLICVSLVSIGISLILQVRLNEKVAKCLLRDYHQNVEPKIYTSKGAELSNRNIVLERQAKPQKSCITSFLECTLACFLYWITCWKRPEHVDKDIEFRYFLATRRFNYLLFSFLCLVLNIPGLVLYFLNHRGSQYCYGCRHEIANELIFPTVVLLVLVSLIVWWKLRHIPDKLKIKQDLFVCVALIVISHFILNIALRRYFNEVDLEGRYEFTFATILAFILICLYLFVYRVLKVKKQASKNSAIGFELSLEDFLATDNEYGVKYFTLFLVYSISLEYLVFLRELQALKAKEEEATTIAYDYDRIARKFIREDAMFSLNISSSDRSNILESLRSTHPSSEALEVVKNDVWRLLQDQYHEFKRSDFYELYLNGNVTVQRINHVFKSSLHI